MNRKITIATVFSGIGAPEEALRQMGIEHRILFACDNDKYCKDTYLKNNKPKWWFDDIKTLNNTLDDWELGWYIELFIGGPPCQSFSVAGKRKGLDDERGKLIFDYIKTVKHYNPRIFILENVPGLLTVDNGRVWEKVWNELKNMYNYTIDFKILNSADFGSVSNRKRLFVIGIQKTFHWGAGDYNLPDNDVINWPKPYKNDKKLSNFLDNEPNENEIKIFPMNECMGTKKWKKSVNDVVSTNHPFGKYEYDNRIYNKCGKFITIITAWNRPKIYDGMVVRTLSVREKLRIMGFGENFIPNSNKYQAYKQVGNSMSVDCLKAIFKSLGIEGETNDR